MTSPEFLVLGLGNPGPRYERTRHNFGLLVVEALARSERRELGDGPGPSRTAPVVIRSVPGVLAVPTTYMNRSGSAAHALRDRFGEIPVSRFLVAYDDLDLPLGRIRFRRRGGDGGHNGVRSIMESLGSADFPRLRLGIGRPADGAGDVIDYVLDPFGEEEREPVDEVIGRATEGVRTFAVDGIEAAMNRSNERRLHDP